MSNSLFGIDASRLVSLRPRISGLSRDRKASMSDFLDRSLLTFEYMMLNEDGKVLFKNVGLMRGKKIYRYKQCF